LNRVGFGRWFTELWGKRVNLEVVDEIAAPEDLLCERRQSPG
jgi:hypothetical protein